MKSSHDSISSDSISLAHQIAGILFSSLADDACFPRDALKRLYNGHNVLDQPV
jgi:hypothetical protein